MTDGGEDGNAAAPRGPARRRGPVRASLDADEFIALMHGSDPVRVELTRLENELRGRFHGPCLFISCFDFSSLQRFLGFFVVEGVFICLRFFLAGVRQGEGARGGADGDTRAAPVGEGAGEGRRGGNPQLLSSTICLSCYYVDNIYSLQSLEREGEKCPEKEIDERERKNRLLLF